MMPQINPLLCPNPGFGLGLRTTHYGDLLPASPNRTQGMGIQGVDWLEIITDNFLVQGGKPLVMLDQFASHYPLAMHGVAMSLGNPLGLDTAYLQQVKQLANRIQPLWISDHLCWTGNAKAQLHDLNPLPYTDEAARTLIRNLRQAQDVLGRRLVVENVSSYVSFCYSVREEWEFLSYVLAEADSLLLLDVNNVYVSSRNHGFAAMDYVRGLPAHRIQQIHLAGHLDNGTHIVDTHDHPVSEGVWQLYGEVCATLGSIATMIERDAEIPPLADLLAELTIAKTIAKTIAATTNLTNLTNLTTLNNINNINNRSTPVVVRTPAIPVDLNTQPPDLQRLQSDWVDYILQASSDKSPAVSTMLHQHIALPKATTDTAGQRLEIYHHAYRSRLVEVLADSFEKTVLYMGEALFDEQARVFVTAHPPHVNSLNRYGATLPDWLKTQYPDNPELYELAQLDWDLRACFDTANTTCLTATAAHADSAKTWLSQPNVLHPYAVLRPISSNIVAIWQAIHADVDVPAPKLLPAEHGITGIVVWRKNLQPHIKTVNFAEYRMLQALQAGHAIVEALGSLNNHEHIDEHIDEQTPPHTPISPMQLGTWLSEWLDDGLLVMANYG